MVKSIKNLKTELEVLQITLTNLAQELEESYSKYFENLGDSVGRQLTLACYQICTQKYPENFLKLSFNDRHNLQQKIKHLKFVFGQKLAYYVSKTDYFNEQTINNLQAIVLKGQPESKQQQEENLSQTSEEVVEGDNIAKEDKNGESESELDLLTPHSLMQFHLSLQESIDKSLKNISRAANKYLQKKGILLNDLPTKILDIALQAEEGSSVMGNTPNLLSLVVEKEQNQDKKSHDFKPITAVCMRLSEIEFSDPSLSVHRNQIRNVLAKIDKITAKYDRTHHQYAIAQAESAWRSSWFD